MITESNVLAFERPPRVRVGPRYTLVEVDRRELAELRDRLLRADARVTRVEADNRELRRRILEMKTELLLRSHGC